MSFLKVNHEEAETRTGFEPLTPGEYEVIASKIEKKQSQAGNEYLKIEFTVRDDGSNETGAKRKIFDNLTFSDKAKWRYQQAFKAFGVESGREFGSIEEVMKELVYSPVRVKIKHSDPYTANDGTEKIREEVVAFLPTQHPIGKVGSIANDPFADSPQISSDELPF